MDESKNNRETGKNEPEGLEITEEDILYILDADDWSKGIIREGNRVGLKTPGGEVILPPRFEDLHIRYTRLWKGVRVVVKQNGKWGMMVADGTGTWILPPRFDYVGQPDILVPLSKKGKWGVFNMIKNRYLIPLQCDSLSVAYGYMFTNGIGQYERKGKKGVITEKGAFTKALFEEIRGIPGGPVEVKYKSKWGYINQKNRFTPARHKAHYYYED